MIQLPGEYDPASIFKQCSQIEAELKSGARKPLTENELAGKTGELEYTAGFQYGLKSQPGNREKMEKEEKI